MTLDPRLAVDNLDYAKRLDPVVDVLSNAVRALLKHGPVKDILHGVWLGHPAHPMLTDIPIGCWTNAMLLDLVAGPRGAPAAQFLVGAGCLAAVPTVWTGLADLSDADRNSQRVGVVHAAANIGAIIFYGASWLARRRGRRGAGIAVSFAGAVAVTAGGYLGGHLVYRRGTGVSRNAFHEPPAGEWIAVADDAAVPERQLTLGSGDGVDVVLWREDGRILALSETCSHLGGPLHEGQVHDGCVTCPWHGSMFRLEDGTVVRGPAQSPQPAFRARVESGKVLVRRRIP